MFTKSGKATVTFENRLVPIAYDGDCASEPIAEATAEAALKGFAWKPGYLGFKFSEVAVAKVKLDGSSEEISFIQQKQENTRYMFAKQVFSLADFAKAAEYKTDYERIQKSFGADLEKSELVIYVSDRGVRFMEHEQEKQNTILINKQGQQLWPQPKA